MNNSDDTILLNHAAENAASYVASGLTPAGLSYYYLAGSIENRNRPGIIYAVDLPISVELHLLCIPKNYLKIAMFDLPDLTRGLEQVKLEGNYSDYFLLFAKDDEQSASRYVLDPVAMAYQLDFCTNYVWEIVNRGLYFISTQTIPDSSIIDGFIRELLPEVPFDKVSKLEPRDQGSFQQMERLGSIQPGLRCPVCTMELVKSQAGQWLVCPDWHGYLITGSELTKVRTAQHESLMIELSSLLGRPPKIITPRVSGADHKTIECPSCNSKMDPTTYQYTNVIVDVCPSCAYRWIDNSELDVVAGEYRNEVNKT